MSKDLQTEELVAKRKNLDRIKDFSKQLRVVNQETIANQRKLPSATEQSDLQRAKQKYTSSRFRALEFAKHVPKPNAKDGSTSPCSDPRDGKLSDSEEEDRVDGLTASLGNTRFSQSADGKRTIGRPKKTIRHDTSQASGGNAASLRKGDHQPAASSEAAARLAELEALHLQKKAQVEAIRRTFRR